MCFVFYIEFVGVGSPVKNEQMYAIYLVGCSMEARLSAKRVVRGLTSKLVFDNTIASVGSLVVE